MGIATTSPIEQTAPLTEYVRALDIRWSQPILGDHFAYDVVGKIDCDFAGRFVTAGRGYGGFLAMSPPSAGRLADALRFEQAVEFFEARRVSQPREGTVL